MRVGDEHGGQDGMDGTRRIAAEEEAWCHLVPVVLSGGSGTRLWPLSRRDHPKQFLALTDDRSLFQETLERVAALRAQHPPIVITHEDYRFFAHHHARETGAKALRFVLEPWARGTAAALAAGALEALELDPEAIVLALPADHRMEDRDAFVRAVRHGIGPVLDGSIVIFGVLPNAPETGYGYIRPAPGTRDEPRRVLRFLEKPDRSTAEALVSEGCLWNAGIFLLRADVCLEEFEHHAAEILHRVREARLGARTDGPFLRLDRAALERCPEDSFDKAVMEKTERAVVVSLECGWSDLGSFARLREVGRDGCGNRILGDVLADDLEGSYVHATSRLVVASGLRDTIVVETADAVLVTQASRVEDLKGVVARLTAEGRHEASTPARVPRPWGWYESLARGPSFQVKRISVDPGASLSLQRHRHRSEHWVVVSGRAWVRCDAREFELLPNQSTYIPVGSLHRLANRTGEPLEIIEVQSGEYLGEDDIERFDDDYGRAGVDSDPGVGDGGPTPSS